MLSNVLIFLASGGAGWGSFRFRLLAMFELSMDFAVRCVDAAYVTDGRREQSPSPPGLGRQHRRGSLYYRRLGRAFI